MYLCKCEWYIAMSVHLTRKLFPFNNNFLYDIQDYFLDFNTWTYLSSYTLIDKIRIQFHIFFSSSSCISEFFDAREYASHSDDSSDEEEDNEIEDDENEANSTDDEQVSFRFFPVFSDFFRFYWWWTCTFY